MIKKVTEEHRTFEQYREQSVSKLGGYAEMLLTMLGEQPDSVLDEIGEIVMVGKMNAYEGKPYFSDEQIEKFNQLMIRCSDSFDGWVQEFEHENDLDQWEAA